MKRLVISIIMSLAVGGLSGWIANGWRLGEKHSEYVQNQMTITTALQEEIIETEREWREKFDTITINHKEAVESLERNISSADDSVNRLLSEISSLQSRGSSSTPSASQCESWRNSSILQSELLGEAVLLARQYAEEADRIRLTALTCEKSYETIRGRE